MYGTSPLRIFDSAQAISRPSSLASRRPNRVSEAGRAMVAVLDMFTLWYAERRRPSQCVESDLMYTRYHNNGFVCIAAIWRVHCSITWSHAHSTAKGRPKAALNALM